MIIMFNEQCMNIVCYMMQVQQAHSQAYKILSDPQAFKELRSNSRPFLDKLANEKQFLFDMLDICVRPRHFEKTHKLTLTPAYPAAVIEAFSALYEDFINMLAFGRIYQRQMTMQEPEQEGGAKEPQENKHEFDFLVHLHTAFQEPQTEQAAMSNLSRLMGPLYYHSPGQMTRFYQLHKKQKQLFFNNLWRRGIIEIFCKLMEAEQGKNFFKTHKSHYIDSYYDLLLDNVNGQNQFEWLESCLFVHKFIMEKMEERYDGSKYRVLLDYLNTNDIKLFEKILSIFDKLPSRTSLIVIKLSEQYIKKDSWIWGSTQLKVPMTHLNRKNSISGNFYSEEENMTKKTHHLPKESLEQIANLLIKIKNKYITQKAALHLISFYKTLYFWTKVVSLESQNSLQLKKLFENIINHDLLQSTFKAVNNHQNCTGLHNYIKQFLLQCLHHKIIPLQYFLEPQNPYLKALKQWLPRRQRKFNVPFGPQSYHIYVQILKQTSELSSELINILAQQKVRREKSIGGSDPRKLQESLVPCSPGFSESSEDIIEIDIASFGSNFSQQEANSPNPAKLSHLTSLQRNNNFIEQDQYEMKEK